MIWEAHTGELLPEHLSRVAELAEHFAAPFGAQHWARAAGLLHDVGKACEAFQRRLDGDEGMVDHAIGGAAEAIARCKPLGRLLAYAVAGHHGGMPDAGRLDDRLANAPGHDGAAVPALPELGRPPVDLSGLGASFFVRMVFSGLTDADFLATEQHYRPDAARRGIPFDAAVLLARLDAHLDRLMAQAAPSPLNAVRRRVLDRCVEMAAHPPGIFALSVPTGGGKTLASLAFALAHARHWGKRRVVTVIPYTSIIEQNAAIYRDALGATNVLEHHSRFSHREDGTVEPGDRLKLKLAEENWDAPVVVTTAVQFFESLFANRPGRCRKLHNLAGAVIVLDEAQMTPVQFLAPCLDALRRLVGDYGCTLVLCTATQPVFGDATWMGKDALPEVVEIVENPTALHQSLRRVTFQWAGQLDDDEVAARLLAGEQAMAVVNTRAHARALFDRIRHAPGAIHLSALMTPAHRSRVIGRIRADLRAGRPCRVVATQLVECGVDLDFPMVLRALAGLDSIIQAAGRCNREGRPQPGQVTVFQPSQVPPLWPEAATLARRVLEEEFPADPTAPKAVAWYFQRLYARADLDANKIIGLLTPRGLDIAFRSAAEAFRLIEEQVDVTIPDDDDARILIARLEAEGPSRDLLRELQRHTVQVTHSEAGRLPLRWVGERVRVLDEGAYDEETGVRV